MQEFDLEQVAQCDGKEGRPVYIVHQGKVYDVSGSKLWRGGVHMRRHNAGGDLSTDFLAAPHGTEVLERYPQVGVLRKSEVAERTLPPFLSQLIGRYPMLARHPHPMTVHFPIVFMMSTTVFNLLYLMTGIKSLETTGLHCLGAGLLFTPPVILTGLFSWWLNYMAKPLRAVYIKIIASNVLLVIAITCFTWRMANPEVLDAFSAGSFLYLLLILCLAVLVGIIGWFGAKLTFPVEEG
jgi:predicted heme/steroid binding protein/uncharacterized membrane protein